MRERRAWLTSVRRAILRVAFLADLVLAIGVPLRRRAAKGGGAEKMRRRARSPPDGEAYSWTGTSRQRRWRRLACNVGASGDALGAHLVVAGDHRCRVVGRKRRKRR